MFAKLRRERAFTLVELLVVIVVIAILAAIILPKFTNTGLRSKESSLKSNLALLRSAVSNYQTDTGLCPLQLSDLSATTAPAKGANPTTGSSTALTATQWYGPYVASVPNDPVSGSALNYSVTAGSVGQVTSSATGNDSQGTPYSSY
jgi:general secretion pathway protein G